MASVFTRILNGEIPGRIVYEDEKSFAILTIAPISDGHTLVIPKQEVDHWIDLPDELAEHLSVVSKKLGKAIQKAFNPVKVGIMVAGLEVPHVHYHLIPIHKISDLNFANQNDKCPAEELDRAAEKIKTELAKN